jgi:endonuclease/exonuclease/phosphatase family metal-dependent hydrolase
LLLLTWITPGVLLAACPQDPLVLPTVESEHVRLVTLNMAHGRKDMRNQMLLKGETIRTNLIAVSAAMKKSGADVIALQEADAASSWSGKFNHVDFIAGEAEFPCTFHGIHASSRLYDFGTALLSKYPFQGAFSHSFKPSKPTTNKGFVVGAVSWNPLGALSEPKQLKIVSVHLDFSRRSVRRSQIDEMVAVLEKIEGPMVVLGDFNTDWQTEQSSLAYFAQQLDLQVFEAHADGLSTYGDKGARLDWILISEELRFSSYAVAPDIISDHYAVAADIVLGDSP